MRAEDTEETHEGDNKVAQYDQAKPEGGKHCINRTVSPSEDDAQCGQCGEWNYGLEYDCCV